MAYNNGYRSGGYRRNYGHSHADHHRDERPRKKSGCSLKSSYIRKSTGEVVNAPLVHGWNASKTRGLISFVASPRKAGHQTSNPRWERWTVKVQFPDGPKLFNGLWDLQRSRLIIPDLKMIANPNAPNGGYFGSFFKRRK